MSGYPAVYNPVVANPNDGENITLCKILDAVSLGTQNLSSGGNAFDVNIVPSIGNGLTSAKSFTSSATAANNLVQVKTSSTLLGTIVINNTAGTDYFLSIYDSASATSSTTPSFVLRARGNSSVVAPIIPSGFNLANGFAFGITTAFGGTTLMGATGVDVTAFYL
jgi:hypothetical protein